MQEQLLARVRLRPPLPFSSKAVGNGFVLEISAHEIVLRTVHIPPLGIGRESFAITICGIDGREHSIQVSPKTDGSDREWLLSIEGGTSLTSLLAEVRKDQHVSICEQQDVESSDKITGFENFNFLPRSLLQHRPDQINTNRSFLGREFALPFLITGMTGGLVRGAEINRRLALAAQELRIPMGVGSQRIALEDPQYESIFQIKRHTPDVFLIGNLGFSQLKKNTAVDFCARAIKMIDADALAIHLNLLQELVQVEGDREFENACEILSGVAKKLDIPIIVKEVGNGIDPESAKELTDIGIAAIDVGGRGGTSWGYIEGLRSEDLVTQRVGSSFRNWGIPTAFALRKIHKELPHVNLIATGGIRDGITAAKALALGANMVGIGLPLLRAALEGDDHGPLRLLQAYARELEVCMACTSSREIEHLNKRLICGLPLGDMAED